MSRLHQSSQPKDATETAKRIAGPYAGDDALVKWAARMIAAANDHTKGKRPDPLDGFVLR